MKKFTLLLNIICFINLNASPIESLIIKHRPDDSKFKDVSEFTHYLNQKLDFSIHLNKELPNDLLVYDFNNIDFEVMTVDEEEEHNAKINNLILELEKDSNIVYAEPDIRLKIMRFPSDERFEEQWHYFEDLGGINLPKAWDITVGDSSIVAAVIDTGIVKHHEYLNRVVHGKNFLPNENPNDYFDKGIYIPSYGYSIYHGSHVAGTIAAQADNGGVVGVSWNTRILPVKVLGGKDGSGSLSGIIDGMLWASGLEDDKPEAIANVLNMSLGGEGSCSRAMQDAIDQIVAKNISIVVAAGNGDRFGNPQPAENFTPASCDNVITVAATNRSGGKARYSNYGAIDIAAPGGETINNNDSNGILSTNAEGGYQFMQGTSMAAPHVTGVVSLMLALDNTLTPEKIAKHLKQSAKGNVFGVGLIDAYKTLKFVQNKEEPLPEPSKDPKELLRNDTINNIDIEDDKPDYYFIDVKDNAFYVTAANFGSISTPIMKMAYERVPDNTDKDCQTYTNRQCIIYNPKPGRYYIKLEKQHEDVYKSYHNLTLWGSYG